MALFYRKLSEKIHATYQIVNKGMKIVLNIINAQDRNLKTTKWV